MTTTLLAHIVDFCRASQQPSPTMQAVQQCLSAQEQDFLQRVTLEGSLTATLLPIFSVGVQVRASWAAGNGLASFPGTSPTAWPGDEARNSCAVVATTLDSLGVHMLAYWLNRIGEPMPSPVSVPQGDARTYNYVAALSSDEKHDWGELMTLAKLIPRICHNVNRWDRVPVHWLS